MKIEKQDHKDLSVGKVSMSCDRLIQNNKGQSVVPPLMGTSFLYLISGASGSGKTSLLVSLLTKPGTSKCGKYKLSYRSMFDNIVFVSPSAHTIDNALMSTIPTDQRFESLTEEVFEMVDVLTEDAVEADEHTLLILDDVSTELRKNRQIEQRLNMLTRNRRHKNLSVICISHRIVDFSPGLRSNSSCIFLFKPKNRKEIDTIINELTLMKADDARQLFDFVYKERHTFLMIDCSLRHGSDFQFFKNFDKLIMSED